MASTTTTSSTSAFGRAVWSEAVSRRIIVIP
jgi:hypothetical protein